MRPLAEARAARPARLRLPLISPHSFVALVSLALLALFLVTVSGATVRLTGSGLGCDNWPRCGSTLLPEQSFHALVEFGNRVVASGVGVVTLAVAAAAFRVRGLPRPVFFAALALPLSVLLQGVLGGITVLTDLHPLIVMAHFLLSLVSVALAVWVLLRAHDFARRPQPLPLPRPLGWLAAALLPVLLLLVVTGAFVTAAGPHSGGEDIRRYGNLSDAIYVHVRASAVFGVGFLVLLAALWRLRGRAREQLLLAGGVLALLVAQMAVGEAQWRTRLPWGLVLVHVALATAVWAGMVALVDRVRAGTRPPLP